MAQTSTPFLRVFVGVAHAHLAEESLWQQVLSEVHAVSDTVDVSVVFECLDFVIHAPQMAADATDLHCSETRPMVLLIGHNPG